MDKISLTASMRSNLLSLQNISRQVDATQNKLSTGKKVNSAIDNPSSYYAARSLNNRASDLDALLDSMGQAVSTIKAATTALETGISFLEQAKAVANLALEGNSSASGTGGVTGGGEVVIPDDYTKVNSIDELKTALADSSIKKIAVMNSLTFADNESITVGEGVTLRGAKGVALNFNFTSGSGIAVDLKEGSRLENLTVKANGSSSCSNLCVIQSMGSSSFSGLTIDASGSDKTQVSGIYGEMTGSIDGDAYIKLKGGYLAVGIVAMDSSKGNYLIEASSSSNSVGVAYVASLSGTYNVSGVTNGFGTLDQMNGTFNIEAAEKGIFSCPDVSGTCNIAAAERGDNPDNSDASNLSKATVNFNDSTARANIAKGKEDFWKVFNSENTSKATKTSGDVTDAGNYNAEQYQSILSQYDALVKDASYKGVNLLQQQDLKVTFNESRTSWLNVAGKDASSAALGLTTTEWNSREDVEKSIAELTAATNQIRSMSSELGSYYNIVTTRQDFTENLINILEEGADKLTLADMNEESANMLALQTRQQLAINSLSLASQAAQSILRLF